MQSVQAGIRYVAKYMRKPLSTTVTHSIDTLSEYILAMAGRRSFNSFGLLFCRPAELCDDNDEELDHVLQPRNGWQWYCSFKQALDMWHYDPVCRKALLAARWFTQTTDDARSLYEIYLESGGG
jgi:hypothetical protein